MQNESEMITVPVFESTKGGGKRVIGYETVPVLYRGPHFITVKMSKGYRETYTDEELNIQSKYKPPKPAKERRRRRSQ